MVTLILPLLYQFGLGATHWRRIDIVLTGRELAPNIREMVRELVMPKLLRSWSALVLSTVLVVSGSAGWAAEVKSPVAPAAKPTASATPAKPKPDLKTQADAGDAAAALKFALPLLAANKSAADQAIGLKYLRQAADAKIADADLRLGDAYRSGTFGLTVDVAKALGYYQLAADAGNVGALDKLGDLYRTGATGLTKDPAKAATFYEQAVAEADNTARRTLAAMLLDGTSLPRDPQKA